MFVGADGRVEPTIKSEEKDFQSTAYAYGTVKSSKLSLIHTRGNILREFLNFKKKRKGIRMNQFPNKSDHFQRQRLTKTYSYILYILLLIILIPFSFGVRNHVLTYSNDLY